MHGLETYVAFLPLCVLGARLDRDRDGLPVCFGGVVLFRVAAAVNFLTDLLVPAAPVVVLACGIAVPGFAPHTFWSDRGAAQEAQVVRRNIGQHPAERRENDKC